ncbi:hypothetical protein AYO42_01415 [Rhizomicrobium sp. SCGC AG-212-E05]|nr:hypothetical protein AYO42_01415 [Rhizomicrobium sp. SCGC AG-212-E05]
MNIQDTLSEQRNLLSVGLLVFAALFAVYRWHYTSEVEAAASLQRLSDILRLEAAAKPAAPPPVGGTRGGTMPDLLAGLQEAASQNNVAIRSMAPDPAEPSKIRLGVEGDFRSAMLFLGRIETFQIGISAFDFAPDEDGSLAGTIDIQHSGKPGAPPSFADYLDAILKYTAVRNPFEIGDPIPLPNAGSDLGDISWTYHLTSITLYGAERVATIDGKDYRVGDNFNGMRIVAMGPSSVSLRAPNMPLTQKLHFRQNPTEVADGR